MSKLQVSSPARRPRRVMARRLLGDGHGCRIRSRLACHAVRASGRWRFATGEGCRRQRREITPPGRSRADLDYFRARKSEVGRGLPGAPACSPRRRAAKERQTRCTPCAYQTVPRWQAVAC